MARRKFFKGFRRKRRRSGGGGGGGRKFGGLLLLNKGIILEGAAAAGGFLGANWLIDKVAAKLPAVSQGYARIGAKAVCGAAIGGAVAKFAKKPKLGAAIAIGGIASAVLDAFATFRPAPRLSGFIDDGSLGDDYNGQFAGEDLSGFVNIVPG